MNHLLRHVALASCTISAIAPAASAQEVERHWNTYADRGLPTERAAQLKIETMFELWQAQGAFEWHVEKQSVVGGRTIYLYAPKPAPISRSAWTYKAEARRFASEQDWLRFLAGKSHPACPAPVIGTPEWVGIPGGGASEYPENNSAERTEVQYQINSLLTDGSCSSGETSAYAQRSRTVRCPNTSAMQWRPDLQACGARTLQPALEIAFIYWSEPLAKQCDTVGNPCDPTTGDKFQTETDLALEWLTFKRHYHSLSSTNAAGFGSQWTHNHNMRLTEAVDASQLPPSTTLHVGLVDSDGSHLAFTPVGTGYEANDGSGDRAVKQGGLWILYRRDEVIHFAADGRLDTRLFDDGSWLQYRHDPLGRLLTITHASGRQLQLGYLDSHGAEASTLSINGLPYASYAYGSNGQVASIAFAGGGVRTYHYEDARFPKHLTGITAEDSRRYSWYAYDGKGRVTCSRHDADCSSDTVGLDGVRLQYNADGTTQVTDAFDRQSSYGLTPGGSGNGPRKVTGIADSEGAVHRSYLPAQTDFRRRLLSETDRRGTVTQHAYSEGADASAGAVALHVVTEAAGQAEQRASTTWTTLDTNRVVRRIEGDREISVTRNTRLQPTAVSVRDTVTNVVRTTTYSYCEANDEFCGYPGQLRSITDPAGNRTYHLYASESDPGCAVQGGNCDYRVGDTFLTGNSAGQTRLIGGRDALGNVLHEYNSHGRPTDFTYHPRGWLASATIHGQTPDQDRTTTFNWTALGQLQQIIQPSGGTTTWLYDSAQRLTDILADDGSSISYRLDAKGNRIGEDIADAQGTLRHTLARAFGTTGWLTSSSDAAGNITGYSVDAMGNLTHVSDPLGRQTRIEYDALARPVGQTGDVDGIAAGVRIDYTRDNALRQVTDPRGLVTRYAHDALGEARGVDSPDTGKAQLERDPAGRVTTRTDARGITTRYRYDVLGRITQSSGPDPLLDMMYRYSGSMPSEGCTAGGAFETHLMEAESRRVRTAYCYNHFGEVLSRSQTVDGRNLRVEYGYDKDSRLTALKLPDGSGVAYQRNTRGEVTRITLQREGLPAEVLLSDITHAPFGPVTGWTYGNGRRVQRTLDRNYRATAISDGRPGGLQLGLEYDAAGQLTVLREGPAGTVLGRYSYDGLGRLTGAAAGNGDPRQLYQWDATGNRTSSADGDGTRAYHYADTSHHLLSVGEQARTYDANGNTLSMGELRFTYNAANRMDAVHRGGQRLASYLYNHLGERVLRTATSGEDVQTVYDEDGRWLGDYRRDGTPIQQAVWLDEFPVALLSTAADGTQNVAYVEPDHLGTPRVVIDSERDVAVWRWPLEKEAFGAHVPEDDVDGDGKPFVLNLRFPGQQYDGATGLHYNYQRDLDAGAGRYVQSDPIGLEGGISTYGYVGGRPLTSVDPFGLDWVTVDHDFHAVSNYGKWWLNRLNGRLSRGMEPNMPGAEPSEFINTTRDVIQEWQLSCSSEPTSGARYRPIKPGTRRRITQRFIQGPDPWAVGGKSYHWTPGVPDRTSKTILELINSSGVSND